MTWAGPWWDVAGGRLESRLVASYPGRGSSVMMWGGCLKCLSVDLLSVLRTFRVCLF
ncbi:MAG: hypothetical protein ACI39U_03720 [Candidatus Cryptobacteroides sp.]